MKKLDGPLNCKSLEKPILFQSVAWGLMSICHVSFIFLVLCFTFRSILVILPCTWYAFNNNFQCYSANAKRNC